MQASAFKNPHDPTMSRDDSADIHTALHGTTPEARDAALQRLLRGPDEPVSFDDPPLPSRAALWLVAGAAFGLGGCAAGVLVMAGVL